MVELLGIFGVLVVLLCAATLCFQSVAIGGIVFLMVVARKAKLWSDELLFLLALTLSQMFHVIANSFVLVYSAGNPIKAVLGTDFARRHIGYCGGDGHGRRALHTAEDRESVGVVAGGIAPSRFGTDQPLGFLDGESGSAD